MNLVNQKNAINKVKLYLSELYQNKELISKDINSYKKEYKLSSGNILDFKQNIFINLHNLLIDDKYSYFHPNTFYLPFLQNWKYFIGFDKRQFCKLRHYILPSGYLRVHCHGGIHYGDYYEKVDDDLYCYAIENYYKNINSLYDYDNEYGRTTWIFIHDFLQYLNSYSNKDLDNLILEWNSRIKDMYSRIQSTKEVNVIHKYTYKTPPPKSECQIREEREETRKELARLTEWEKQYDARRDAEEVERRSQQFW